MATRLYIDVETYSSVDLKSSGLYKYVESPDFEILLLSYAFDDSDVVCLELINGDTIPNDLEEAFFDDTVEKWAHNAMFERCALRRIGYNIPIEQWRCSMIKAAYCGLPFSLDEVSKALNIKNKKLDIGRTLIRYFSMPCKPTISNGKRTRNYPSNDPEKWAMYCEYNIVDVEAEREIIHILDDYELSNFDAELYILDQEINDRGILVDIQMAQKASDIEDWYTNKISNRLKNITHLDNPNSPSQLKAWLSKAVGEQVNTLAKDEIPVLLKQYGVNKDIAVVLDGRQKLSKSSVKKYTAMLNCACNDKRTRGLFQFYGANRTGRWAGRLVQLQNLSKNAFDTHDDLIIARNAVKDGDGELLELLFDDVSDVLSQLVRTAFIAEENNTILVADFNSIEARVLSWLADETWRIDVFNSHGKIYEASASMMFNVPIEQVTKDSEYRAKGKNAELALGYQGAIGAMKRMGGEKMGMTENEMWSVVRLWRQKNPKIVEMWSELENNLIECVRYRKTVVTNYKGIVFSMNGKCLIVTLPSGHMLYYWNAKLRLNSKNTVSVSYEGINPEIKTWDITDTYGGKIVENIVQAISRDILGQSMLNLRAAGFNVIMHVHDEVLCEDPKETSGTRLIEMCNVMEQNIPWAEGLTLKVAGYETNFYLKD